MKNIRKEIEIKLTYKNKARLIHFLEPKIQLIQRVAIHDTYYGLGHSDMKNSNNLIRIRSINKKEVELTFKGQAKDIRNVWHREEITTNISSEKTIHKIFQNLGFNKISEYKSIKEYWKYDNLEICFANFSKPAKLAFMEIEGRSQKQIEDLVKVLKPNVMETKEAELFKVFDQARNIA